MVKTHVLLGKLTGWKIDIKSETDAKALGIGEKEATTVETEPVAMTAEELDLEATTDEHIEDNASLEDESKEN